MGQPGLRGRTGEDAYNIAVGGTCRRGRVALFELDVRDGGRHGEFQEAMSIQWVNRHQLTFLS